MVMTDEMRIKKKRLVMAYLRVLFHHLLEGEGEEDYE
jgi:hypothetical protein